MKNNLPSSDALLVAIRAKCMDCSGNQRREVERCRLKDCPLHPYRSVKAIGGEHERQTEIKGQVDLFDILMTAAVLPNPEELSKPVAQRQLLTVGKGSLEEETQYEEDQD